MKPTSKTGHLSRRTVLRGIGAAGATTAIGSGIAAARPDKDRGRPDHAGQQKQHDGRPDHAGPAQKDFSCPEGMDHLGTFEFVIEEDEEGNIIDCYFEQTEGDMDIVMITGFDSKEDEACEPITVYYESTTHDIGHVASYGGKDTHVDDAPEGGVYDSELENPGGQQAAISLLHICGSEIVVEEPADDTTTA